MTEDQPRNGFLLFLDKALKLVGGLKEVAMILAALSVGGASGTLMAKGSDTTRLDKIEARQDSADATLRQMQQNQMEMFSAQIEADTTLKAVLQSRAADRRQAADARAETKQMFDELTGGNP